MTGPVVCKVLDSLPNLLDIITVQALLNLIPVVSLSPSDTYLKVGLCHTVEDLISRLKGGGPLL